MGNWVSTFIGLMQSSPKTSTLWMCFKVVHKKYAWKKILNSRFRTRAQLQVLLEAGPKSINFMNLLRCHRIKKGDVWWYEVVSKC